MRLIHPDLLADLHKGVTTLCSLALIGPLPDGSYRPLSGLDKNVVYDPNTGVGERTFVARTGFQMTSLAATADLGVDNAEAQVLTPVATYELEGITQAQIDAGVLDKVSIAVYLVNYKNLAPGRHAVQFGGTVGELRTEFGLRIVPELRSLSQQAKQPVGEYDSKDCRATFGSQPIGTGGGVVEERFPCGYDFSGDWILGTVTSQGAETDLMFFDAALIGGHTADEFVPGVVQMLSGLNVGLTREIESFDPLTGKVVLQFAFPAELAVADEYQLRWDCPKTVAGCRKFFGDQWVLHFRGEPNLPSADAAQINTPGASLSGGPTGTGEAA